MLLPLANSALCKRSSGNGAAKQHKNSTLYESAVSGGLALTQDQVETQLDSGPLTKIKVS